MRVLGVLDAGTGRVMSWEYGKLTASRLGQCWLRAGQSYPAAKKIYLVMDNWPVHFHPRALGPLAQDPRLEIVKLPTYAPWLNPIEKVWRLVKERVSHAHPWCDNFRRFREEIMTELGRYTLGSPDLLHYVGLKPLITS